MGGCSRLEFRESSSSTCDVGSGGVNAALMVMIAMLVSWPGRRKPSRVDWAGGRGI